MVIIRVIYVRARLQRLVRLGQVGHPPSTPLAPHIEHAFEHTLPVHGVVSVRRCIIFFHTLIVKKMLIFFNSK